MIARAHTRQTQKLARNSIARYTDGKRNDTREVFSNSESGKVVALWYCGQHRCVLCLSRRRGQCARGIDQFEFSQFGMRSRFLTRVRQHGMQILFTYIWCALVFRVRSRQADHFNRPIERQQSLRWDTQCADRHIGRDHCYMHTHRRCWICRPRSGQFVLFMCIYIEQVTKVMLVFFLVFLHPIAGGIHNAETSPYKQNEVTPYSTESYGMHFTIRVYAEVIITARCGDRSMNLHFESSENLTRFLRKHNGLPSSDSFFVQ